MSISIQEVTQAFEASIDQMDQASAEQAVEALLGGGEENNVISFDSMYDAAESGNEAAEHAVDGLEAGPNAKLMEAMRTAAEYHDMVGNTFGVGVCHKIADIIEKFPEGDYSN